MKVKDLLKKENIKKAHKPTKFFSWKYEIEPKLLLDKRSLEQIELCRKWKVLEDKKAEGHELFKIMRLCLNEVIGNISMAKNLVTFPSYKIGTKGYLLSDNAINFFPLAEQHRIKQTMDSMGSKLCLFKDMVLLLPKNYYRILRYKKTSRF